LILEQEKKSLVDFVEKQQERIVEGQKITNNLELNLADSKKLNLELGVKLEKKEEKYIM